MAIPTRVSFVDLHRQFLALESELELFDLRFDSVAVWERVRKGVFDEIKATAGYYRDASSTDAVQRTKRSLIEAATKAAGPYNPFFRRSREVLVWGHNRRQRQSDGTYWELYCDPVYDEIDLDYLHLELPHQGVHYQPAQTENLAYMDLLRMAGTVRRRFSTLPSLDQTTMERIKTATDRFNEAFGTDLDLVERVREAVADRRLMKDIYDALLKRQDPSLVIVVVSYGKETFIEACKDRSIPVVELQHGIINPYHYGYSYPENRRKETFPDLLLTWGEYWNETVEYPLEADVTAVGYPYLERQSEQLETGNSQQRVIFISQPNHVGEYLADIAVETGDRSDFEIIFKLHPEEYNDWGKHYPELAGAPVTVVGADGPPLYELFSSAKAQVGMYSTAVFEGLQFGLQTYLFQEAGVDNVSDLLDIKGVETFEKTPELVSKLDQIDQPTVETERFFRPGSISNMRSVLSQFL